MLSQTNMESMCQRSNGMSKFMPKSFIIIQVILGVVKIKKVIFLNNANTRK